MTARSVIHDTFTIERSYPAAPSRMFAAFASAEAKNTWGDTGDLEPADGQAGVTRTSTTGAVIDDNAAPSRGTTEAGTELAGEASASKTRAPTGSIASSAAAT